MNKNAWCLQEKNIEINLMFASLLPILIYKLF
jgi:hypothetical protein